MLLRTPPRRQRGLRRRWDKTRTREAPRAKYKRLLRPLSEASLERAAGRHLEPQAASRITPPGERAASRITPPGVRAASRITPPGVRAVSQIAPPGVRAAFHFLTRGPLIYGYYYTTVVLYYSTLYCGTLLLKKI